MQNTFLILFTIVIFNSCKSQTLTETDFYGVINTHLKKQSQDIIISKLKFYYKSNSASMEDNFALGFGLQRFESCDCEKSLFDKFPLKDSAFFRKQLITKQIIWKKHKINKEFSDRILRLEDLHLKKPSSINNYESTKENSNKNSFFYKGRLERVRIELWETENKTKLQYIDYPILSKDGRHAFVFIYGDQHRGFLYKKTDNDSWIYDCKAAFLSGGH